MYLLILQAFPRKRGTAQQRKAPLRLQICVCLVCVINSPGSDPVRAAAHKLCVTERPGSDPGRSEGRGLTPNVAALAQVAGKAQLAGTVIDARTKAPLEQALVKVDDLKFRATAVMVSHHWIRGKNALILCCVSFRMVGPPRPIRVQGEVADGHWSCFLPCFRTG